MRSTKSLLKRIIKYNNICIDNPNIKSSASYFLLARSLMCKDTDYKEKFKWLKFRDKYLQKILDEYKTLHCEYCNHGNLKLFTKDNNQIATLDHIIPTSKGGELYNPDNLAVSCHRCNQRKANHINTVQIKFPYKKESI